MNKINIDEEMKKEPKDRHPDTFKTLLDEALKFGIKKEEERKKNKKES